MKYSEIREILNSHGIQLTKSLGQNFLHDANQLEKIAAAARLTPEDQVLEIGPGLGPLTELLIRSNAKVLTVELDSRLIPILSERFQGIENFELRHGDGVALMKEDRDWQKWKLIREKQPREEEEIKSCVNIWTWMCFPLNKPMHYLEFLYIFPLRISFPLLNMYCSLDCIIPPKMKHIS